MGTLWTLGTPKSEIFGGRNFRIPKSVFGDALAPPNLFLGTIWDPLIIFWDKFGTLAPPNWVLGTLWDLVPVLGAALGAPTPKNVPFHPKFGGRGHTEGGSSCPQGDNKGDLGHEGCVVTVGTPWGGSGDTRAAPRGGPGRGGQRWHRCHPRVTMGDIRVALASP